MNKLSLSEEELARAVKSAAGGAEPSVAHVEAVRSQLLARTRSSRDPASPSQLNLAAAVKPPKKRSKMLLKLAAMAAVVLLAFMASQPFNATAVGSLRSALDATRQHVWIHGTTTVKHSGGTIEMESWCSPRQRIFALSSPQMLHFVNYEQGVQSSFSEDSGKIYRWHADLASEDIGRVTVNALLNDGDLNSSFPFLRVSRIDKENVRVENQQRVQYTFQLVLKVQPAVDTQTVILVDPSNEHIVSWEEHHADGTQILSVFDYPEAGPTDIFELGAKPDAKVVDRVASSDVVELADQFQQQVYEFDDYRALVIDRPQAEDELATAAPVVRRLCRAGERFAVHLLTPIESEFVIPTDADLVWWQTNHFRFKATPLAICDGEYCRLYPSEGQLFELATEAAAAIKKPTAFPVVTVTSSNGSSTIPVWPTLWPEYACRPMLMTSDPSLRFDVDPTGSDGPPNTLRLNILAPDSPFSRERASYWLSLEHNRCVAKSILLQPSFESFSFRPVERRITTKFSHFQRSPRGFAFASQASIDTSDRAPGIRRTFIVDFD